MNQRDTNELKRGAGYLKEKALLGLTRVTGDELDRALMKVTSHMLKAPKEKHMQRLLATTYGHYRSDTRDGKNLNDYIVSELEKRTHTHNWIVVLKTLVTLHRLMTDGSSEINTSIQRSRNLFCARNIKNLSEDVEGATQGSFIRFYMRYLEERASSQQIIGAVNRIDNPDFASWFRSLDVDSLTPLFEALLKQLTTLTEVEYRESIVNNFCTLEAYQKLIDDGKTLYQLLSDRIVFILDGFGDFSIPLKRVWFELYRQYSVTSERLRFLFNTILDSSKVFPDPPPRLKALPPSLLEHLEDDIRLSSIPKEDVTETLESLGIFSSAKDDTTSPTTAVAQGKLAPSVPPSAVEEEQKPWKEKGEPPLPPALPETKKPAISMDDLFSPSSASPCPPPPPPPQQVGLDAFLSGVPQVPTYFAPHDAGIGATNIYPNNDGTLTTNATGDPFFSNNPAENEWSTGAPTDWQGTAQMGYPFQSQTAPIPKSDGNEFPPGPTSGSNATKKSEDPFKSLYADGQKGWYSKDT